MEKIIAFIAGACIAIAITVIIGLSTPSYVVDYTPPIKYLRDI